MMNDKYKKIRLAVILALTLGLAPFYPEPHIVGKVKWLLGGAKGMEPMDYFDVVLHGGPWVYLLIVTITHFTSKESK
jgi:hypothetical protein